MKMGRIGTFLVTTYIILTSAAYGQNVGERVKLIREQVNKNPKYTGSAVTGPWESHGFVGWYPGNFFGPNEIAIEVGPDYVRFIQKDKKGKKKTTYTDSEPYGTVDEKNGNPAKKRDQSKFEKVVKKAEQQ